MDENGKNRAAVFFEEKGFYIILFLCIVAIGVAGYVFFFQGLGGPAGPIDHAGSMVNDSPGGSFDYDPFLGAQRDEQTAIPEVTARQEEPAKPVMGTAGTTARTTAATTAATSASAKATTSAKKPESTKKTDFFVRPVPGEVLAV